MAYGQKKGYDAPTYPYIVGTHVDRMSQELCDIEGLTIPMVGRIKKYQLQVQHLENLVMPFINEKKSVGQTI